jgi:hypothetical protein
MPARILRVMKEVEGKPVTGNGAAVLGIRFKDIGLEENALDTVQVGPGKGGMSVAGCLRTFYAPLLPKRFEAVDAERFRGARGNNSQKVWSMGDDPYLASPVTSDLNLCIEDTGEPPGHGSVEPNRVMPLAAYRAALASTQDQWQEDETHPSNCPVCKHYGIK